MPVKIDEEGNRNWFNEEGERHREDGPAIEDNKGYKMWYLNGKKHRGDGPAFEWWRERRHYWIGDKPVTKECFDALTNKIGAKR